MPKKKVCELLVERLMQWGVDTLFTLAGDGINGIYEVLRQHQDSIKLIHVRHEEAAAYVWQRPDPAQAAAVMEQAFKNPGPVLIEAMVAPHEPPMPGHVSSVQAWNFAESMLRGEKDRWDIIKTVIENKFRRAI